MKGRLLIVIFTIAAVFIAPLLSWLSQPSLCTARAAEAILVAFHPANPPSPLSSIPNRGEGERIINFTEQQWVVKSGADLPPRANAWSDSELSVNVDAAGRLHMRIRQINGVWHSAQVIAREPAHYGLYRILIESPLHEPHPNVVLGLFLYRDDTREIDIEFSRRLAGGDGTALFAVQPSQAQGHRYPFRFSWQGESAHEIHWQPDWICFRSLQGHETTSTVAAEWLFDRPGVPRAQDDLRFQINLWMLDPSQQDAEVEVIITAVQGLASSRSGS